MLLGRVIGWVFLGISLLLASGDAVMALGPGDHAGIVTRDLWLLFSGRSWDPESNSLATPLMAWPAWTLIAPMGLAILWACRPRRRRAAKSRRF